MVSTAVESPSLPDLIATKGIKMRVTPGAKTPITKLSDWHLTANGYSIRLTYQGRSLTTDFWMGRGCKGEPMIADTIEALISVANCGAMSFADFCSEFGSNPDSRKDFADWKDCVAMNSKMRRLFGADFDAFAESAAEY